MADYQSYNSEKLNAKEDGASLGSAQLVCLGEGDEWLLINATACKQAVLPLLPDGLRTVTYIQTPIPTIVQYQKTGFSIIKYNYHPNDSRT